MNSHFTNRYDAGKKLASLLLEYKNDNGIVLAIPRGGVPVAAEIARALNFPLGIVLVRKIGHPTNKEYSIGAASLYDFFITDREGVTENYIADELKSVRTILNSMNESFNIDTPKLNLNKKTVVLVDDGVATGNTIVASVKLLKLQKPARLIIAVPVATKDAIKKMAKIADEVITIISPEYLPSIGSFYEEFEQASNEEVKQLLKELSQLKEKAV